MSTPVIPHGIGVRDASVQFPTGRWPDQISYSARDVYLYSVNPSPQIQALDHVHVVNYDLDVSAPYTMNLQLPVMNNLPSKARFYFFYVSRCHNGDTLTFSPVSLSGDTVNGVAGPHSFTLTGTKVLFVCVGVKQNYIIHPINNTIAPAVPVNSIPTVNFNTGIVTPVFGTSPSDIYAGSADVFPGPSMFSAEQDIITGMEGYLVPNVPVPTQPYEGFQCTQSGIYFVQPSLKVSFDYTVGVSGVCLGFYQACFNEFDASGTYTQFVPAASYIPFTLEVGPTPTLLTCNYQTGFFYPMQAGRYYVPSFTWDASSSGTNGSCAIYGNFAFCYWAPLPSGPMMVPGPSAMFSPMSALPAAPAPPAPAPVVGLNEIVMGSKSDNSASRLSLHKKQVQGAKDSAARQASASSYPAGLTLNSAGGGQIGLNDLETIVRQIMRVQAQQPGQQQSAPASPVIISSSSSASSSSSSSSNASGKKRARDPAEYVGTQPPAKR